MNELKSVPTEVQAATPVSDVLLVQTLRRFLRDEGEAFSEAAIRDLPPVGSERFTPDQAVAALIELGYEASFGDLPASALTQSQCPMICFLADGSPVIVSEISAEQGFACAGPRSEFKQELRSAADFAAAYSGHVLMCRKATTPASAKHQNWFLGTFAQGKWLYFQVILAAAMSNFLGLSTSIFTMVIYDRVVPNQAVESLIALTIGVTIALAFDFIIKSLRANFIDRASKRADSRMSRLVFDKILTLRLDARNQKSGAIASVVREFDTLREFFTSATLVAVVDLPFIFFFIFVIYLIGGKLAIVPLVAVPLVIGIGLAIQPILARLASGSMSTGMSKQSVLVETLNGLETIQATGAGRLMRKRFEEATASQSDLGLRSRIFSQFAINSSTTIQQIAQVALIFYGVFLIQAHELSMGGMIAAVMLASRALAPLGQLASALTRANSARQAYRSLDQLMRQQDDGDETEQRLSRPVLRGEIELRNVTYRFPGSNTAIIQNLSLKIPAGQKVAVVGRMGSGKSTLMRLCAGLVRPTEGAVLIDGIDLRQIDKSDLQRNVGVMLQETWLFSGSIRENLQMGFYEYDDEQLLKISRISGIDEFVRNHPAGYDLQIKERGVGLSGGQRQSINLGRALLHEPSLLVLDEPTSAMDTATEAAVLDNLKAFLPGRTMLAVTHRNTLLKLVDRVLVVDRGTIIMDAPPEQLTSGQK